MGSLEKKSEDRIRRLVAECNLTFSTTISWEDVEVGTIGGPDALLNAVIFPILRGSDKRLRDYGYSALNWVVWQALISEHLPQGVVEGFIGVARATFLETERPMARQIVCDALALRVGIDHFAHPDRSVPYLDTNARKDTMQEAFFVTAYLATERGLATQGADRLLRIRLMAEVEEHHQDAPETAGQLERKLAERVLDPYVVQARKLFAHAKAKFQPAYILSGAMTSPRRLSVVK